MLRMPHLPRALLVRLLVVAALLASGLAASSAVPARYDSAVDITFPTVNTARFTDDYTNARSGGRVHRATDLFAPMGTPVYAAMSGQVVWAPGRHATAGYALQVSGDDGRLYAYYHLGPHSGPQEQAYAPGIRRGVRVTRGQLIGYLGDSGNAAGGTPHLHFEIHDSRITDPYGTNRMNPFASLREAVRRGDFGGRTGTPASSRDGDRQPVLRLGDRGPAVAEWQGALNRELNARLATDGAFGPATDRATRDFQRARGLTVDGIVGPSTRAALSTAVPVTAPSGGSAGAGAGGPATSDTAVLRLGARGPAVATWQGHLNQAMQAGLVADGVFGPATDAATRAFQRARGLAVDGVVGPATRAALGTATPVVNPAPSGGGATASALLRLGDRGPAVATWQATLNRVASAGLAADGVFGPATDRATRDFQRARGLTVDGVVGPATRRAAGGA
jgi:peptidoglycan hydrolase-like protein with peptidoglycan-binding domain